MNTRSQWIFCIFVDLGCYYSSIGDWAQRQVLRDVPPAVYHSRLLVMSMTSIRTERKSTEIKIWVPCKGQSFVLNLQPIVGSRSVALNCGVQTVHLLHQYRRRFSAWRSQQPAVAGQVWSVHMSIGFTLSNLPVSRVMLCKRSTSGETPKKNVHQSWVWESCWPANRTTPPNPSRAEYRTQMVHHGRSAMNRCSIVLEVQLEHEIQWDTVDIVRHHRPR